jgi:glucose-6-phosphate isomerase
MKNNNPTTTDAWKNLEKHFSNNAVNLKKAFKENPNRKQDFTFDLADLSIDFSKNLITKKTLELLLDLAKEMRLEDAISSQFTGNKINHTENRSVLHTALRDFSEEELWVSNKNIKKDIQETLGKIETFSNDVISKKLKGYTNKPFTDIVNIGIGGSDLGPKMVVQALQYYKNHLNTHFISNIDGDHSYEILKNLNPETTLFVIVSKTFTTQETLSNANFAREWFLKSATKKDIKKHFVAVSTNLAKVTEFGIDNNNIFPMWNWVGGRYSLWSAVGLSIALSVGFTNFKELLKGANELDKHFKTTPLNKNLPVLDALISIWYNNFYQAETEAILPYSSYLTEFVPFIQQLMMESNGKSIDNNGQKVTYQTGNIIWGNVGTNMQHAFMQLIHQGTKLIPTQFIGFKESLYGNRDHQQKLMANFYAQQEALAFGKAKEKVHLDLKLKNKMQDVEKLLPYKIFDGNRPSTAILLKKLTPFNLGVLIAFYEQKTFAQGVIWNINSFDQFGVELGKELANKFLK